MKLFISILFCLIHFMCYGTYHGQCAQDKFVHENFFWKTKNAVFIDIGAHDGVTFNNTLFFEEEKGWKGICIEPIPEVFAKLKANRKCICIQGCVTDREGDGQFLRVNSSSVNTEMLSGLLDKYDSRHLERVKDSIARRGGFYETLNVKCYLFNHLLEENGIKHVNFLSIDTEGGEFDIVSTIDFSRFKIDVIILEDNYKDSRYIPFFESKGFVLAKKHRWDLYFVNKKFKPSKCPHKS